MCEKSDASLESNYEKVGFKLSHLEIWKYFCHVCLFKVSHSFITELLFIYLLFLLLLLPNLRCTQLSLIKVPLNELLPVSRLKPLDNIGKTEKHKMFTDLQIMKYGIKL